MSTKILPLSEQKTDHKTSSEKSKKMMDVTKPKASKGETKIHLDIPKRAMARAGEKPPDAEEQEGEPKSAPPISAGTKKLVVPVSIHDDNGPTGETAAGKQEDEPETESEPDNNTESGDAAAPAENLSEEAGDAEPEADTGQSSDSKPAESTGDAGTSDTADGTENAEDTDETFDKGATPDQTKKAVEAAEAEFKRTSDLEDHINKRDFFVPINRLARRRSLAASAAMTLMVLILAAILVDLMLDTGMILLVQKIPHTHFFEPNPGICHTAGYKCVEDQ